MTAARIRASINSQQCLRTNRDVILQSLRCQRLEGNRVMRSRRRLLEIFSKIDAEPLRALVAELVQLRAQNDGVNAPVKQYKAAIDSYARRYGDTPDTSISTSETPEITIAADDTSKEPEQHSAIVTLTSLILRNFGSYYGEHKIDLCPTSDKRNVTAVVGSNGDGKSTLFYALNWALYGDEYLSELQREKGRKLPELVNRRAVMEAEEQHRPVDAMVLLHFTANGHDYYVARDVSANPTRDGEAISVGIDRSTVRLRRIDPNGNHAELLPSALGSLLSGLPSHVKEFYLFDGERINRFVSPGSQVLIRAAIRRVMGIEDLEKTAEELGRVMSQFRTEAKREAQGELSEVTDGIEKKSNEISRIRERLSTIESNEVTLTSRIAEIDALLERTPDTQPLKKRRQELESDDATEAEAEARLFFEVRELAAGASAVYAGDAVQAMVGELESRRSAGEIPGPINRQLLHDLLSSRTCICGTSLEEGSEHRVALEYKLEEIDQRAEQNETLIQLWAEMSSINRFAMQDASSLDRRMKELARIQKQRRKIRTDLEEISNHLATLKDVDRSGWEQERRGKRSLLVNVKAEKLDLNRRQGGLSNEIRTLKAKEAALTSSQGRAQALILRANWAEAAQDALRYVFKEFAAIARRDVEASTATLWKTMLGNVTPYSVHVGEDFELSVKNQAGQPAINDLAMGQQQCLGLAFITAVAQVAESRPPLIIDMPFGRLGADVAASVAATLPKLTNQLILFVLPETEWNTYTRRAIEPYLAREYWIRYDPDKLTTQFIAPEPGSES